MKAPFRLLSVRQLRTPEYANDEYAASFRTPDGEELGEGLPAASDVLAIHNLFEADAGRPLAKPFAKPYVPLCRDTLWLCRSYAVLHHHRAELMEKLWASTDTGEPLHRNTAATLHHVFSAVQDCFAAASRITSHLPDDAGANKSLHPIFAYAHRTAGEVLFQCVPMTLNMLGHDAEMVFDDNRLTFTADLDIKPERDGLKEVAGWPTEAAVSWWRERDERRDHFVRWQDRIIDIAKRMPEIYAAGATKH